jgi:hypothetical protein
VDRTILHVSSTWDGTAIEAEEAVRVVLIWQPDCLAIEVEAPFHDDPRPPEPPGSLDGLWNYEVVEVFISDVQGEQYSEIELSPWGHFLGLRFCAPRVRDGDPFFFRTEATRTETRWSCKATLERAFLPPGPARANAFSIHGPGDSRRYLAASPSGSEEPDFHRPADFPRIFSTNRPTNELEAPSPPSASDRPSRSPDS